MKVLLAIFFIPVLAIQVCAQQEINFGSNGGKFITVNKTKIYYEEYGKGMPLLLLHGGFGDITNFKKCIPELSKKFRVIAADSPSHGRSGQTDSLTYPLMADHFSKMIDLLKLDSVYVMGWSDGGVIALTLAADRPDKVKKVIATGANTRMDGMDQGSIDFTNSISVEAVEAVKATDEFVGNWLANYQRLSGSQDSWKKYLTDVKKMWLTEVYIPSEKLKSISIPVMLVFGDKDLIKLEHGLENFRTIKGSQLSILPNTSHDVYNERSQMINMIAIDFFK
jgi:pimeloyl-ACP methyl ester carboxylesterase